MLVSGPDKAGAAIPGEAQLAAVLASVEELAVTPWIDRVRDEPLVADSPAGPGRPRSQPSPSWGSRAGSWRTVCA